MACAKCWDKRENCNAISESENACNCRWIRRHGGTGFADIRDAYVRDVECTGDPGDREGQAVQQLSCGFAAEQVQSEKMTAERAQANACRNATFWWRLEEWRTWPERLETALLTDSVEKVCSCDA